VRGGHGTTWSGYGRYSSEKIAQRKNTAAEGYEIKGEYALSIMTNLRTHIPADNGLLFPVVTKRMFALLDSLLTTALLQPLNFQFENDNVSDPKIKYNKISRKDEDLLV
jgi:hypothetical protein